MPFVSAGDGVNKMVEPWSGKKVQFDLDLIPSASGQIELAFQKYLNQDFADVSKFVPAYLKEFQSTGH
jgi:hypothetical protein